MSNKTIPHVWRAISVICSVVYFFPHWSFPVGLLSGTFRVAGIAAALRRGGSQAGAGALGAAAARDR